MDPETTVTCRFGDAPWAVREAFIEQIKHVQTVADRLSEP